jgi:tRNA(Ile)-lysidine synthase
LHGIPVKKGKIVRPLLFATRQQIFDYAVENKLQWREDSSNSSDKYLRNKIRHKIVPVLTEMNPVFRETMSETFYRLKEVNNIYKQKIEDGRADLIEETETETRILLSWLDEFGEHSTWLFELLKPYGFNFTVIKEIVQSLNGQPGKIFLSHTHRLVKDREHLIITPLERKEVKVEQQYLIHADTRSTVSPLQLKFDILNNEKLTIIKESNHALIDFDKLVFPLILRKWQPGDRFIPLGMKNFKKLSDFFINEKMSLSEKENTWLLLSGDEIVWISGRRIDNRFKINKQTKHVFHVTMELSEPDDDSVFRKISQILW